MAKKKLKDIHSSIDFKSKIDVELSLGTEPGESTFLSFYFPMTKRRYMIIELEEDTNGNITALTYTATGEHKLVLDENNTKRL